MPVFRLRSKVPPSKRSQIARLNKLKIAALFAILLTWVPTTIAHANTDLLNFQLKTLDKRKRVNLAEYKAPTTALVFFEAGCNWCLKLMSDLEKMPATCKNHLQPIAIGIDTGDKYGLTKLVRKANISFPAFKASPRLLAAIGGVQATPYTLFADKNGNYLSKIRGYVSPEQFFAHLARQGVSTLANCSVSD